MNFIALVIFATEGYAFGKVCPVGVLKHGYAHRYPRAWAGVQVVIYPTSPVSTIGYSPAKRSAATHAINGINRQICVGLRITILIRNVVTADISKICGISVKSITYTGL